MGATYFIMTIKQMERKLYAKCGLTWLDFYYEKLNEREDFDWAVCECYNKYIVGNGK